jgi:hypothetical protein
VRIIVILSALLLSTITSFAGEIREFDLKTIERLGNELTRVSQTSEKGATTPEQKRAKQTVVTASKGKLFDIHYDFVVLDDPSGNGLLVYALGSTRKGGQYVLGGHVRVSVSADGGTVKRVDLLSHTLLVQDEKHNTLPKGSHLTGMYYNQIVSNKPVETLIYASSLAKKPIFVGTPDGKMWQVANGKMWIDKSKPGNDSMSAAARKAFNENGR